MVGCSIRPMYPSQAGASTAKLSVLEVTCGSSGVSPALVSASRGPTWRRDLRLAACSVLLELSQGYIAQLGVPLLHR